MMKLLFNEEGEYLERPTIGGILYAHEVEVEILPEWEGKLEQLRYVDGVVFYDPTANYLINRINSYPSIQDQLDMQYWDKVNGTTTWEQAMDAVKAAYPKP